MSYQSSSSSTAASSLCSTEQLTLPKPLTQSNIWSNVMFEPRTAVVARSNLTYPRNHLLGVPQEIRDRIWLLARHDIQDHTPQPLHQYPKTGYEGLIASCRQIFHEVPHAWGQFVIQHNRVPLFITQTLGSSVVWDNFRSLYLEIPHQSPSEFFTRCAFALRSLGDLLEDVRIYGVGTDMHNVVTSSMSRCCGKFEGMADLRNRKLARSGQGFQTRLPLVNALQFLTNVRVMVLDNLNLPLLAPHVFKNKSHLRSLYVGTDHRSTLHDDYRHDMEARRLVGSLIFEKPSPPPVKELHVAVNSMFKASHMIASLASGLEVLTVTIPDQSLQSGRAYGDWIADFANALTGLGAPQGNTLRTFKLCIEATIWDKYHEFGTFIGAFRQYVPLMTSLKSMELHMRPKSDWMCSELIQALPISLEKLYISETFNNGKTRGLLRILANEAQMHLQDSYDVDGCEGVGDDLTRKDFLKFSRKKLNFIGYEYVVASTLLGSQEKNIDVLVKLNALLLDRTRNQHLARLSGKYIPWYLKIQGVAGWEASLKQAGSEQAAAAVSKLLEGPMSDEVPEMHVFATEDEYFGGEEAAEQIFYREPVAKISDVQLATYPVVVDVEDQFKHSNHWICEDF